MANPKEWTKPREEVEQALVQQLSFLRSSCKAYDNGVYAEAMRIAACIFIIVHDGKQRSLLTQLSIRRSLRFCSYHTPIEDGNLLSDQPLVSMKIDNNGVINAPLLGSTPRELVQFHQWWEKDEIFRSPGGFNLTRRRLVFSMRNQDGGGHVDPVLSDESYVEFSRSYPGWIFTDSTGNETQVKPRPHLPTMRHIGFELEQTLQEAGW